MSQPFGFSMGSPDPERPFDLSSLGAALQQLGAMLQNPQADDGQPVRWSMVRDLARQALAAEGDPVVADAQRRAVEDAARLADLWLDHATGLPPATGTACAWSRAEWLEATMPAWQRYVAPVAESLAAISAGPAGNSPEDLIASLPEELRAMLPPEGLPPQFAAMLGPMMGMMRQMSAMAFSTQLGQALAALASEVLGSADIGIPLTDDGRIALLPRNVEHRADELTVARQDLLVFAALRESAHQRLFAHVPWLRARLVGAIEEYARGITIDPTRMQEALGGGLEGLDLNNPDALQQLIASGVLVPEDTPEQRAALTRLETLLACIEGWVDDVVDQAIDGRLPSAAALRESMRRQRASGGAAERALATLIGMELRPRRARDAATVFAALRATGSSAERDALWGHPDLLPSGDDLDDPLGFVERSRGAGTAPDDLSGLQDGSGEESSPS